MIKLNDANLKKNYRMGVEEFKKLMGIPNIDNIIEISYDRGINAFGGDDDPHIKISTNERINTGGKND